jgi:uncharacterized protein (DUF1778 family)
MAIKKMAGNIRINSYTKGVGQRSKKRKTGVIVQSLRLLVSDNNLLHQAAKVEGISFNGWATITLKREAGKILQREAKLKLEKKKVEE